MADEVVGLESVDAMEVVEVVMRMRMRMTRVTSNSNTSKLLLTSTSSTFSCNLFKGCIIVAKYILFGK